MTNSARSWVPSISAAELAQSEQRKLGVVARRTEARRVERRTRRVELESLARKLEAPRDQVGEEPRAAHARAEVRVVVATAAHLLDDAHHVCRTQRVVLRKPVAEQILDLVGKAQHGPAR